MSDDIVKVVPYDPAWPQRFAAERDAIVSRLGHRLDAIEPVGSTAIPGLAAKPTIDLMVGVDDLVIDDEVVANLQEIGYSYLGEYGIPGRHFFRKGLPPTHHVHWVMRDGDFWKRQLLFRDYVTTDPRAARRYERLKRDLAARYHHQRSRYTESKSAFIQEVLIEAERFHGRRFLIVDLEATCWEDRRRPLAEREIIEIGAVLLGPDLEPRCELGLHVRPVVHPVLSSFCTELTGISQETVDAAPPFPHALAALLDWIGEEPVTLCSWGEYDRRQLLADCARHLVPYPQVLARHVDLRTLFARQQGRRRGTMPAALERLGLDLEGVHHRGLDDARNVARIAQRILSPPRTGYRRVEGS